MLVCPHASHPPVLYILVMAVWCCLHRWPSCVPGVAEGLSSDAYQHSEGTQCPNYRGFPSVAGMSAFFASTYALHSGAGSAVLSAHTALRCACGVSGTQLWCLSACTRHPVGPECLNWIGFPSVTGVSASLASTCALHIGAGSVVLSAQMALLCAWGG